MSHITVLAGFINVGVKVSSILCGCVWLARANRRWCRPSRGGVGEMWDPAWVSTVLQWQGGRSGIFLSPWVTYDLPSRFTHPQELARNTVNHPWLDFCLKLTIEEVIGRQEVRFWLSAELSAAKPVKDMSLPSIICRKSEFSIDYAAERCAFQPSTIYRKFWLSGDFLFFMNM